MGSFKKLPFQRPCTRLTARTVTAGFRPWSAVGPNSPVHRTGAAIYKDIDFHNLLQQTTRNLVQNAWVTFICPSEINDPRQRDRSPTSATSTGLSTMPSIWARSRFCRKKPGRLANRGKWGVLPVSGLRTARFSRWHEQHDRHGRGKGLHDQKSRAAPIRRKVRDAAGAADA